MKQNKVFEFDLEIYPRKIWVAITRDDVDGFDLSKFNEQWYAQVECSRKIDTGYRGIFVRFSSKNVMTPAIMAHEAVHVATDIFEVIGAKVDNPNDETFAYLVGYVVKCFMEARKNQVSKANPTARG